MKTDKALRLYDYGFLDIEIKHLEMIQENLDRSIDTYLNMINDDEWAGTKEDAKEICLSLIVESNRINHQLIRCIDNFKDRNNQQLNSVNGIVTDNKIRPDFDMNFKRQFAGWK